MTPLLIAVGADKGGVGKTTIARALDDYLQEMRAVRRPFDCEAPNGDLSRFVASSTIVDALNVDDQMKIFDSMRGVTMVDIKAGLFTDVLESWQNVKLLDDVRDGKLNLLLFHVLGPSAASLREIAHVSETLGPRSRHVLVKNYVNESGYKEWESDPRFASTMASARSMEIPHLQGRVTTEIQRLGVSFADYTRDEKGSYVIRGLLRTWLAKVNAAFDSVGTKGLVEESS